MGPKVFRPISVTRSCYVLMNKIEFVRGKLSIFIQYLKLCVGVRNFKYDELIDEKS